MKNFKIIFALLLFVELAEWIATVNCPNGFIAYNNACVQSATSCPPNFVWQAGICLEAALIPTGCAQNTALQNVPCTSPGCNNGCPPGCCPCTNYSQCFNTPQTSLPCTLNPPCNNAQPTSLCQNNQPYAPTATPCGSNTSRGNIPTLTPCENNPQFSNPQPTSCTTNQVPPATTCAINPSCPNNPQLTPCPQNPPTTATESTVTGPTHNITPPTLNPTLPPGEYKIECPPGTVLIDGICRLIGCGKWFIYEYRAGKCIKVECPVGTHWTGEECTEREPTKFHFSFNNTVITQISRTEPAIVIDNVNNLNVTVVNAAAHTNCSDNDDDYCENSELTDTDYNDVDTDNNTKPNKTNCCTVITPRICKPKIVGEKKLWSCFSRRYKRCGSFCIAPTIYLKAPDAVEKSDELVLPPRETGMSPYTNEHTGFGSYDCSGCMSGQPQFCSPYCRRTVCPPLSCRFYDQRQYCQEYPGVNGCREHDGCYSDWCSGGP